METRETLGYLKGIIDGMDIDETTKEGKVLLAIVDVLDNIVMDIEDMTEGLEVLGEHIDLIDEDLEAVEDYLEDEDYDDFDDCDCCDCCDDEEYEIECPSCQEIFVVDEETILEGEFECPNCGEHLEFEIDCDCDCDDCCED